MRRHFTTIIFALSITLFVLSATAGCSNVQPSGGNTGGSPNNGRMMNGGRNLGPGSGSSGSTGSPSSGGSNGMMNRGGSSSTRP